MLKSHRRLRRELIYRKHIENRDEKILDRKSILKNAVNASKLIPTDLQRDAVDIYKSLEYEDAGGEGVVTQEDNEYKWAGVSDPKIVITTSRQPSSSLQKFAKEIKLMFPNSTKINRGGHDLKMLVNSCVANEFTDLIILSETRGRPDEMIVCHLPHGPTAYFNLDQVVMRHEVKDIGKISEEYPQLVFEGIASKLGERVKDIFRFLFPVAKETSRRIISLFSFDGVKLLFRHHTSKKENNRWSVSEQGPRFELKLFKIIRGTIDLADSADVEYQMSNFTNASKTKTPLWDKPVEFFG